MQDEIEIETYRDADAVTAGFHAYAEAPETRIQAKKMLADYRKILEDGELPPVIRTKQEIEDSVTSGMRKMKLINEAYIDKLPVQIAVSIFSITAFARLSDEGLRQLAIEQSESRKHRRKKLDQLMAEQQTSSPQAKASWEDDLLQLTHAREQNLTTDPDQLFIQALPEREEARLKLIEIKRAYAHLVPPQ